MSQQAKIPSCPRCECRGHKVRPKTLESLLVPAALASISDHEGWLFCDTPLCEVIYYNASGGVLESDALSVPVGVKRQSAPRPVCYCFDHSVESLQELPQPAGVLDEIKGLMKTDGCRCVFTNPQGRCCLATVQSAIDEIEAARGIEAQNSASPKEAKVKS